MPHSSRLFSRCALAVLLVLTASAALANGRLGRYATYEGEFDLGSGGPCIFLVEIEPVLLRLSSVAGKYKLIRLEVENKGDRPVALSHESDEVVLHFGGRDPVHAILDLFEVDPAFWDDLPAELRTILAYPQSVEPDHARNIYLFLAETGLEAVPLGIEYRISSVSAEALSLHRSDVAAAE